MKKHTTLYLSNILFLIIFFLSFQLSAQILYTQNTAANGDVFVREDLDYGRGAIAQAADDFEVPAGQTWTINQVDLPGRYSYPGGYRNNVAYVIIKFYIDDAGHPGEEISNQQINVAENVYDPNLQLTLPANVVMGPGIYWMVVYPVTAYDQQWFWKSTAVVTGSTALFKNVLHYLPDVVNWTPVHIVFPTKPPVDMLFTLHGTADGVAGPASPDSLVVSMSDSISYHLNWNDNATNETGFIIEHSTDGVSFAVVATVGAGVTTYIDTDSFDHAIRYYYRVAASGSVINSLYSNIAFSDAYRILYQPSGTGIFTTYSQRWRDDYDPGYVNGLVRSADDFIVPQNQLWVIKKIKAQGSLYFNLNNNFSLSLENAIVEIFSDAGPYEFQTADSTCIIGGKPAISIYKSEPILIPYQDREKGTIELVLPHTINLTAGHYWFSIYPTMRQDEFWSLGTTTEVQNVPAHINDPARLVATDLPNMPEWAPLDKAFLYDWEDGPVPSDLLVTLFGGSVSHGTVDTISAPVAKPALHVTPTSFTANWLAVEGVNHYELDVMTINDTTFLPGYENKIVDGTSQVVTGTRASKRYMYVVRAVNEVGESVNSNSIRVAPNKGLTLRTVCSNSPAEYRRWKIINNNPFAVDVTWQIPNTPQTGTLAAAPGETFFTTQTIPGINYALITWYDDNLAQFSSLKSATWKSCSDIVARGGNENDELDEETTFIVQSYPNPVIDKFNIAVSTPDDADVDIQIFNIQGQPIFKTKTNGNTVLEVDAANYSAGLYIIKATQSNNVSIMKVSKK